MNFETIEPKPVTCRQSSISCAISCERKWFCKNLLGIRLRGGRFSEAASLGRIYHKFHECGQGNEQEVKRWIQEQQNNIMARVDKGEDLDGSLARQATALTELYHKALVMAQIFWEKYPQPSYFKVIGKEVHHTMQFDGLTLEGTIDKILLNEQDNSIWIRDHKSTGRTLEVIFGGISWSLQARMYRILAHDYLLNNVEAYKDAAPNIKGFILDGILKPGIKMCKTDLKNAKDWNCTQEEAYLRRVKDWYSDKGEESIMSRGIIYTEHVYPTELRNVFSLMRRLSGRGTHPDRYNRDVTRKTCFEYERQCEYHDLCSTDPAQWDSLFENKYEFAGGSDEEEV